MENIRKKKIQTMRTLTKVNAVKSRVEVVSKVLIGLTLFLGVIFALLNAINGYASVANNNAEYTLFTEEQFAILAVLFIIWVMVMASWVLLLALKSEIESDISYYRYIIKVEQLQHEMYEYDRKRIQEDGE